VPRARRRAIDAALRHGEAVDDPALARLAADTADRRLQEGIRAQRRLTLVYVVLAVVWLIGALTDGRRSAYVFVACWLALAIVNAFATRRRRQLLERARAANRELAAQAR
jgi:hypothetical protein